MPKIDAPTVAEHRAQVQARLVDAAEEILRAGQPDRLTAGAVSSAAGIARNSIYRYVDSVEDLRALVVARYLPAWLAAVDQAMAQSEDPGARVVTWVRANLEQAAASGHGWLMEAVRAVPHRSDETLDQAHSGMRDALSDAWFDLLDGDEQRSTLAAAFTLGILEGGFRQLDAGQPVAVVLDMGGRAAESLVRGFTAPANAHPS
jgi:AcrR family transcriptional regulator